MARNRLWLSDIFPLRYLFNRNDYIFDWSMALKMNDLTKLTDLRNDWSLEN